MRAAPVAVSNSGQTLGERVRSARRDAGLSQAQLAGDELTKGFISQIESGLVRPSIRSLQHIAQKLGKPLDYFIADEPLEKVGWALIPFMLVEVVVMFMILLFPPLTLWLPKLVKFI